MVLFEKIVERCANYTADDFLNEEEVKNIFAPVVSGEETPDTKMMLIMNVSYIVKQEDDTYVLTPDHIVFVRGSYKKEIDGKEVLVREFYCYEDKVRYFIDMVKQRGKLMLVNLC